MSTILLVIACVPALLCLLMFRNARRARNATREQLALLNAQLERVKAAHELNHWFVWWMRNAAEPWPLQDPQRQHQLRYAIAAMLCPHVSTFIERMHSVSTNPATPHNERLAAATFVGEWELAQRTGETPWNKYTRETGRVELYAAGRLDQLFRDAVHSWAALLGERAIMAEASRNCPEHETAHH
jgi:hypothetical protein